jgi:hypothetical protein
MSTNSRINGIEQIEAALRTLEAYGYTTLPLWTEHNEWLAESERSEPTEEDAKWAAQHSSPSLLAEHTQDGVFEVLSAARCFSGRQYTLSSGQRDVLRARHGMTPTKDILIRDVALFKGTNLISQFTLCSTEHIDVRRRRHVLTEVVISPASAFFAKAAQLDKEREAEAVEADVKRVKEGKAPISIRAKAMQYFE